MKYYILVQDDFSVRQEWADPKAPYLAFRCYESSLSDCLLHTDEKYYATYDSLIVGESESYTYEVIKEDGDVERITLEPGEYGLRPESMELLSESIPELEFLSR